MRPRTAARATGPPRASLLALLLAAVVAASGACVGGVSVDTGSALPERPHCDTSTSGRSVTVHCLGLSFRLPPSFQEAEHADLAFLARSSAPPGVLSIDREGPRVVDHEPEPGESMAPAGIDGVEAVVVTNAHLEDLAPGLEARELLVANGDQSFSMILSAPEAEVPSLWDTVMSSVTIDAAGSR